MGTVFVIEEYVMERIGMVVEGGGLRGIYAAGVLDSFMDHEVPLVDGVFGVSAGAIHATSYITGQRGRSIAVNLDYIGDKRYISWQNWLKTGNMIGAEFTYQTIPRELNPYLYDTYREGSTKLYAGVSNLLTGEAEYIRIEDMEEEGGVDILRASASLPLFSKAVMLENRPLLDGGICDSIPIQAAIQHGFGKNIVILTQPDGYEKGPSREALAISMVYRKYPKFVSAAKSRHITYNHSLARVREEEEAGRALVFRPSTHLTVKRLDKNPDRIMAMYNLGYADGVAQVEEVKRFLTKDA